MALIWELDGNAYYAAVTSPSGTVLYRLVVESTATGWEWTVWRPGEERQAQHGEAGTVQEAMREAEAVTVG